MSRRVVITGGSCISSLGMEVEDVFSALKSLKNRVVRMNEWDMYAQMNTRLASPILYDLPEYPRKKIRGAGRVALLSIASADKAIQCAGLAEQPELLKSGRVGVAYGSSMGSINPLLDFFSMLKPPHDCSKITATTYIRSMPQTCAVNVSVFFGTTGRIITTNTACTSGSLSIGYAYEAIKYGMQDVMIAGGADELDATESAVFDTLFATSVKNDTPELTPAPFDSNRDGLVIGEGAGTLILEEYEHAKARGAHIYAELVGFAESWATYGAFKERAVPISSLKGYIGHTLGACGGIESWLSINMMNRGWFNPNLNLKTVDPACAPLDYIMGSGREFDTEYIMSNNFAFGGVNTSLIFKRV